MFQVFTVLNCPLCDKLAGLLNKNEKEYKKVIVNESLEAKKFVHKNKIETFPFVVTEDDIILRSIPDVIKHYSLDI